MDQRLAGARLVKRGDTTMVAVGAREMTVTDAARLAGLTPGALRIRLRMGWPVELALAKPMAPNSKGRRRGNYRRAADAE